MEHLNSVERRKLSATESMRSLEKMCSQADQRLMMRRTAGNNGHILFVFGIIMPMSMYWCYHTFAPTGVMQNYKSGSGAYMNGVQNIMYRLHSQTSVWRPEIELKEQTSSKKKY